MERANKERAKNEALRIVNEFGYKEPYVDPVRICRELIGIDVFFADFEGDESAISGFFYHKNNAIYVNKQEYPKRQTFTIAHELGHKMLHEDWVVKTDEYQVLYRDTTKITQDWREVEANTFAANLLVPKFMLDRYRKIATVEELATLFVVSMPVIKNRLYTEYGI